MAFWLAQLMQEGGKKMVKSQQKYKEDFHKRVRPLKETVEPGRFVFVRKKFYRLHNKKHKLAPMTEGSFQVVSVKDTTVVVHIEGRQERWSRDRVKEAPSTADLLKREVLKNEFEEDQTASSAKDTRTNEKNMQNDKEYVVD